MTQHIEAIWKVADKLGGSREAMSVSSLTSACRGEGIPMTVDDVAFILARIERHTDHFVPRGVAEFIAKLIKPFAPKTILDPWAGMGFLAIPLKESLFPDKYEAYSKNPLHVQMWQQLEGTAGITLHEADALAALANSPGDFDAVVSCPPWGAKANQSLMVDINGKNEEIKDDYGHLLMLESCRHLAVGGVGIFIVFGGFFLVSGKPGKARHALQRMGIRVTSAIELPAGTFAPLTYITTHIVVLQRSTENTLFTGSLSPDEKQQEALLRNLRERKEGKSASLGRIVPIETFGGFTPIELGERVVEQARRMGLVAYPFAEVVSDLNAPPSSKDFGGFDEVPNAVYLPQMASTAATTSQDALPEMLKSYYQLVLKPEITDAEFLAGLLNTSFGQLWRDSIRTGETSPRIGQEMLEAATIYLPPQKSRALQGRVMATQHAISRLRSELNELEQRLWRKPGTIEQIESSLKSINREERLEEWVDAIPFPLASILWVCLTQGGSENDQKQRMVQFFEALAEFLAIIHLSAFSAHPTLWPGIKQKLGGTLKEGNLSFRAATFGLWTRVCESLFAELRRLQSSEEDVCFELYKTRSRDVLKMISSKQLVSIFQATNKIRNRKAAHTGAIGGASDREANEQLRQLIAKVREVFGTTWEAYELLLPEEARFKSGAFQYSVRRIMGTRTPFAIDTVEVVEKMEDGNLYFKSPDEKRGLRLLPLVKIMPSPRTEENACYFFSSDDKEGHQFLSYHYQAESEVTYSFDDVSTALSNLALENGV
ncbi:MAG: N-6 DNA methylase [Planctomycetota bacterium]|nr:N-6 DNA methylase [Planctomycetota bacterium]